MEFGTGFYRSFLASILGILILLLQGCADEVQKTVPVAEAWRQPLNSPITYTVQPGDTLYSIAWAYGLDYRQVAASNAISTSYAIHTGQKLTLCDKPLSIKRTSAKTKAKTQAVKATPKSAARKNVKGQSTVQKPPQPAKPVKPAPAAKTRVLAVKTARVSGINWAWPARGCILSGFTDTGLNKGINITSRLGAPITATADGKVVYAGNGLRGYGELIIIKHSDEFLSAYAHNQKILIQDGQMVKRGQVIALMGDTDAKCVMLHFEIRKAGKPVDPSYYLPK